MKKNKKRDYNDAGCINWRQIIEEALEEENYFEPVELEPGVWLY